MQDMITIACYENTYQYYINCDLINTTGDSILITNAEDFGQSSYSFAEISAISMN